MTSFVHTSVSIEDCALLLDRLRERTPLVQAITNSVVTNVTANVLLALGASPAMVDVPAEAGAFAAIADGVLINLGTPHEEQRRAMHEAAEAARTSGVPWVLDPVAVGFLPVRTSLAADLLAVGPTIIRGNASEILALAGVGAGGRGVDASDGVEAASEAASELALRTGAVVAVSGPVDHLTDGRRWTRVGTGTPLLTRVTGGGCALGAVMAAFASLTDDALLAATAATTTYTIAAQRAAASSGGPGSFAVAFLDALSTLTAADVRENAVLS